MPGINTILAYAIAALMAVIIGLSVLLYIDHLKIAAKDADIAALTQANDQYKIDAQQQNDAINKLAADSKAAEVAAAAAVADAVKKDKSLTAQIALFTKTAVTGDPCVAADKLFNLYIGGK